MRNDRLLQKVKEAGFECFDDFVKANLHYLSTDKQRLFYGVIGFKKEIYNEKVFRKPYYNTNY
jgi:hypothetical protein